VGKNQPFSRRIIHYRRWLTLEVVIIILAANPALAISIGTITGVVICFASQNVTANVLASSLMVATRTVRIEDTVTVAGNTGEIIDITLMHTLIITETGKVYVPNAMMVNTPVQRRNKVEKPPPSSG
jgi:small-conductance mechanosensitive channel